MTHVSQSGTSYIVYLKNNYQYNNQFKTSYESGLETETYFQSVINSLDELKDVEDKDIMFKLLPGETDSNGYKDSDLIGIVSYDYKYEADEEMKGAVFYSYNINDYKEYNQLQVDKVRDKLMQSYEENPKLLDNSDVKEEFSFLNEIMSDKDGIFTYISERYNEFEALRKKKQSEDKGKDIPNELNFLEQLLRHDEIKKIESGEIEKDSMLGVQEDKRKEKKKAKDESLIKNKFDKDSINTNTLSNTRLITTDEVMTDFDKEVAKREKRLTRLRPILTNNNEQEDKNKAKTIKEEEEEKKIQNGEKEDKNLKIVSIKES